jgi:Aldolase/RraA
VAGRSPSWIPSIGGRASSEAPVAVGGVVVSAGDVIVTDADGVVLVPQGRAAWATGQVDQVVEKEEALRRRIVAKPGTFVPPRHALPPHQGTGSSRLEWPRLR